VPSTNVPPWINKSIMCSSISKLRCGLTT
jgi:hypothetical protein